MADAKTKPAFKSGDRCKFVPDGSVVVVSSCDDASDPPIYDVYTEDGKRSFDAAESDLAPWTVPHPRTREEKLADARAAAKAIRATTKAGAPDFDAMTIAELHEHARAEGINLHGAASKDEIVKRVKAHHKEAK